VKPEDYNKAWWELRRKYQGIARRAPRTEEDFDPGAKYRVPANVPYTRYFLADILQFQFHRALAKTAGCTAPLNRCSIYGNQAAGRKLIDMLAMGCSRPGPTRSRRSPGKGRWTPRRSSTTSRRSRSGSTSRTRASRWGGSCQLSVVSCQLSVVSYQLSVSRLKLKLKTETEN
jgi:hypothetical protein